MAGREQGPCCHRPPRLGLRLQVPQRSLLDTVTLALWEQCAEEGLFRYDVTACPTKVLPGQYGFVAQLNEGRATKKRATEFRMDQVGRTGGTGAGARGSVPRGRGSLGMACKR